jgi:hypothetical protein
MVILFLQNGMTGPARGQSRGQFAGRGRARARARARASSKHSRRLNAERAATPNSLRTHRPDRSGSPPRHSGNGIGLHVIRPLTRGQPEGLSSMGAN